MAKRRVALSIAVSEPKPLPYLAAAINGARQFHDWAQALGYQSTLLTDDVTPVTMPVLRQTLLQVLHADAPIDRLALYFAGHGLIREAEEGLWLLSDWDATMSAVAVERLKRRLRAFRVQQISIFADACRSLPLDIDVLDLTADGVLGRGPDHDAPMPAVDKFIATQDGAKTYAVPGKLPTDDRCLFSGVLLDGLWGQDKGAFSRVRTTLITSSSLGQYLKDAVPRRADTYGWKVVPNCAPTFPEGDDVYFGDGPPPVVPERAPWPPPSRSIPTATIGTDDHDEDDEGGGSRLRLGKEPWQGAVPSPGPTPFSPTLRNADTGQAIYRQIIGQDIPGTFETRAGFALAGARVLAVWTDADCVAGRSKKEGWWHIGRQNAARADGATCLHRSAPCVIECDNGMSIAATVWPEFLISILCETRGASALVYRRLGGPPRDVEVTASALAKLQSGGMREDESIDLGVKLRRGKHADPVLGVISAYLYDSIGDLDSIRRMAYFYVTHGQPIPYDIALVGQLATRQRDGAWKVHVPAVEKRLPRTTEEVRAPWAFEGTGPVDGDLGGFWPWMRQGWLFLDDSADSGLPAAPGLLDVVPHVTSGRFTTLDAKGGERLIELFRLKPWRA